MRITLAIAILSLILGCETTDPRDKFNGSPPPPNLEEDMIQRQRRIVRGDSLRIEKQIQNLGWDVMRTGTGLRYEIYKNTQQDSVVSGNRVLLKYNIMNLRMDTLYSSSKSGLMDFMVDHSNVETGLHELVKCMRYGESARAVIPSHLAHGFAGDDYKIPPLTSLVFDITVLE